MKLYILALALCGSLVVQAQNSVRRQIDSERDGTSFTDDKTYEKSRSFIRRDSTYYLGYLLQGGYLFYRANDELGFRKASIPLQKALDKIEKDYDPLLRIRTNNFAVYNANYRYHFDYGVITYFLGKCYQNIEDQDKAMMVARHVRDRNFQVEINTDSYNTMAWLYHRNRMYTSSRFSFLKNSVEENVQAANQCLDSALRKIREDVSVNNGLYDPSFLNRQFLSTFFYKAMIHDYLLDIDSASYYYDILIQNNAHSSNNYAEFKLAMGEFEEAEVYFREAEDQEQGDEKRTKEFYYMRGMLAMYRGHPEKGDTLLTDVLQKQGSTPGYGWHSIGLARAQQYEGLTTESQEHTNKAARFQELHIGTTWGQEQYNLAVASLNYGNALRFKQEFFFEHDEWYFWLNPVNWYRWVKHTLEVRHHKMVLASLIAENPEREQVFYSIFSPENLISFDEVWSAIEGFGNEYFIKIYEERLATDKRPRLKKYFRYFLGKLYLAEGKESEAIEYFKAVLEDPDKDDPYQSLLMARTAEGMALATSGKERAAYTRRMFNIYPQLVPFSDLTMQFQLQTEGADTPLAKDIMKDLRRSRIAFDGDDTAPLVSLKFSEQGKQVNVSYQVLVNGFAIRTGTLSLEEQDLSMGGVLLAYRIFNIQKSKASEQVPASPVKVETNPEKKAV
ncbi:MAG: hypothetical protein U0289_04995 [Cyclobacteriaceae bacterium]